MKDELYGAYDSRSAVSKSPDPEKTLSDADRIKTLEKQVKELRELISGFKATSPLWGDIKKGVGLNEKALQISKKISSNIPYGVNIGDMIYWNGSQWTLLSAPGSDSVMLFDFSGTGLPIWQTLIACP